MVLGPLIGLLWPHPTVSSEIESRNSTLWTLGWFALAGPLH